MFDDVIVGSVLTGVTQVTAGWVMLSVLAAAAWCVYRAPGRDQRLALEAARDHAND